MGTHEGTSLDALGGGLPPGPRLFKDAPPAPVDTPTAKPEGAPETKAPDAPLVCARCGHPITRERHRTAVNGRHEHTRVNPYGYVFHFGCFAQAEGCRVLGPPTAEDSWFPGFVWEYAHCAACRTHLGWVFHGAEDFFGLLMERLSSPS
jgi:hypothetical protein